MAKYYLTNKAVQDLTDIWNYTFEQWSEQQADKYYQLLLDTCREIAENPDLGKNYEGINHNLHGLRINRHIIFFRRIDSALVEIIRILHVRMDLKVRFWE